MTQQELQIKVALTNLADNEQAAELCQLLAEELREIDSVETTRVDCDQPSPEGAKGNAPDFTSIFVNVMGVGALGPLASSLLLWITRDRSRTIELTVNNNSIKLTGLSPLEQQDLVKWFKTQASKKTA